MVLILLQKRLLFLSLFLAPFLSLSEIASLFSGSLTNQVENVTPTLVKGSKDLVFIAITLIGMIFLLRDKFKYHSFFLFLLFAMFTILAITNSFDSDYKKLVSGLRWILPFFMIFFVYNSIDKDFIQAFSRLIVIIFCIHFSVQVLQFFYASAWFGTNYLGFNSRNPGIFLIPNTGAFFTLISLYVVLFILKIYNNVKLLFLGISSVSIALTLSGTGVILLIFIAIMFLLQRKNINIFPLAMVIGGMLIFKISAMFVSRGKDYINISGGTRLDIFMDIYSRAQLISANFGHGTNTAVMLNVGSIVDSLYASILLNIGLIGFFAFVFLFFLMLLYSIFKFNRALFTLVILFIAYSATTITFEVYPVNLIFVVLFVYFWKGVPTSTRLI